MTDDLMEEIMQHLFMIEHAYGVRILDKDDICGFILRATSSRREILTIALALNNWMAVNSLPGNVRIGTKTMQDIIAATVGRW
jgi:hypothetical protein